MLRMVICVKQVPDTTEVRIDPETNTLIREGVPSILNPFDAHATEAAAQLTMSDITPSEPAASVTHFWLCPPISQAVVSSVVAGVPSSLHPLFSSFR